jgi:hypothetical protein
MMSADSARHGPRASVAKSDLLATILPKINHRAHEGDGRQTSVGRGSNTLWPIGE